MDSNDSFYLRPCKQLPSPTIDRQASHLLMGQHLGTQSSGQVQVELANCEFPTEPSTLQSSVEDGTYETYDIAHHPYENRSEQTVQEISEQNVARLLKGKAKDWATAAHKKGPMQLLNLPLDILKIILKEVTHTNDLANCAKVNSAFHSIVTPMIYSRFDIVWPDTLSSAEPRAGVDALTYGLATLVMREDLFESVLYPNNASCGVSCQSFACQHCGSISYLSTNLKERARSTRGSRRGNYFSQFVKKFSLGNGPTDWVQEYLVTKESGKMLGTLVALSIARMPNLESFVWDMPTGLLRDIWTALSSLSDHRPSKLEKLWVRFHNNHTALRDAGLLLPASAGQQSPNILENPIALPPNQEPSLMDAQHYGVQKVAWFDHHIEQPNFSTIPPLRSLTVLDIDETRYLVELSMLLGRSLDMLRELRLGIASTLNIPPSFRHNPSIAPLFNDGVLALLMSKIYDQTRAEDTQDVNFSHDDDELKNAANPAGDDSKADIGSAGPNTVDVYPSHVGNVPPGDVVDPAVFREHPPAVSKRKASEKGRNAMAGDEAKNIDVPETKHSHIINSCSSNSDTRPLYSHGKLKLEILEMERLTRLSPSILSGAIDFTVLTSLTLLRCGDQSNLWHRLSKEFTPRVPQKPSNGTQTMRNSSQQFRLRRKHSSEPLGHAMDYRLGLKRIHTDAVSSNLISFLRTTLAPNTLEWLFLQDTEIFPSPITLETIYRGPFRRHRLSLTKVMIDSARGSPGSRSRVSTARKWMFNRDVLAFVTSGKMCKLRELAAALEYKDWHFFLQRLPNIPQLRSLYVPNMSDHPYGNSVNVKDLALSAIDVVALRPEVELCYLAIKNKCFEILERKPKEKSKKGHSSSSSSPNDADSDDDEIENGDNHREDDTEESDDDGGGGGGNGAVAPSTTTAPPATTEPNANDSNSSGSLASDNDDDDASSDDASEKPTTRLKLREILFYDDKISIFKARHGRL